MTPRRVVLPSAVRDTILAHAREQPGQECCGLLVGRGDDVVEIAQAHKTPNIAPDAARRFDIDPQHQFDLLRGLRGTPQRIVGHYHSHPEGPAAPSGYDLSMAFDPEAVWLIVALPDTIAAFVCADQGQGFMAIAVDPQL